MAFEHETGESSTARSEALLARLALALSEFVTLERAADGDGLEGTHEGVFVSIDVQERDGLHEARLFTIPLAELVPAPTLFRWVAVTANRFRFGALGAYVRDDGLVNLNLTHSTFVDAVDDEALRRTLLPVIYTSVELRREAWSLFGA